MVKTIIDLTGNEIHADKFVGGMDGEAMAADVAVPEITVGGLTVGPGTLIEVLEELMTEINTKADA